MKPHWRRVTFLGIFLVAYMLLSFVGFWMSFADSTLFLHDGEPLPNFTAWQKFQGAVGGALIEVLWFPAFLAGRLFRPLPGSDWFWIVGSGILYGIMSLALWEWIRVRRRSAQPIGAVNSRPGGRS